MMKDEQFNKEKAEGMDRIANTIFAPVYPVLAEYFLDRFGRRDGVCIDLGSGPGHLAIAVAKASSMHVYALDKSESVQTTVLKNIMEADLKDRITPLYGDVSSIPLPGDSVDLVVSRGSIFFWDDLHAAFCETARILRPGGMTFIGGGFGNADLRDKVVSAMTAHKPGWKEFYRKNMSHETAECFQQALAGIDGIGGEVVRDESGTWVVMRRKLVE